MRMHQLFLAAGFVLLLSLASQAQEERQKPHPLLQKLSYRIGEWEADITVYGVKIGSTRGKWRWAAGGNVLLYEGRSQVPTFNIDDTGLQVVTVEDDSIVLRSYSSTRDKEGVPARSEPAKIEFVDGKIVTRIPPRENQQFDRFVEELDKRGESKSISAMKGDALFFKITNSRRVEGSGDQISIKDVRKSNVGSKQTTSESEEPPKHSVQRDIVYTNRNDEKLLLDAYVPDTDGPHAAIMLVHGGGWSAGDKSSDSRLAAKLANRGFAVFSIDYRLAPKHKFPAQLQDCREALRWIYRNAANFKVDRNRLGAWGGSAGGHLVALLGMQGMGAMAEGAEETPHLACIICSGTPCDFRDISPKNDGLAFFLGGTREEVPEAYDNASPAAFVSKLAPPSLFVHGEDDALVSIDNPKQMVELLRKAGAEAKLIAVPGAGHNGLLRAFEAQVSFLTQHLKPQGTQSE